MSEKSSDIIAKSLGIGNDVEVIVPKQSEVIINTPHEDDDIKADYNLSRRTFRDLINKGNQAMESLTDLAKESESPRAYEVLATMMRTVADTTKDLFELQNKNKNLKKEDVSKQEQITVEKAVFVGTTAELLQKVKRETENDK